MLAVLSHVSNRQWSRPQLSDEDKRLLLLMKPGLQGVKLFSYHDLDTWRWLFGNLQPKMWVVRLNHRDDLPALARVYAAGYRGVIVELYNEPNNPVEGFRDINDFCDRFDEAAAFIHEHCPGWQIAFPGLSPNLSPQDWWAAPRIAVRCRMSDYIGVHSYYTAHEGLMSASEGGRWVVPATLFPRQSLMLTEFCCTSGEAGNVRPTSSLASEYAAYATWLAGCFPRFKAIAFFILGSDDPHWAAVGEIFDEALATAIGALRLPAPTNGGGNVDEAQLQGMIQDIFKRQGVNVNTGDSFYKFIVQAARTGTLIYPMPSPDGNYYVQVGDNYIAYTNPVLYCPVSNPADVHLGLPPFQA